MKGSCYAIAIVGLAALAHDVQRGVFDAKEGGSGGLADGSSGGEAMAALLMSKGMSYGTQFIQNVQRTWFTSLQMMSAYFLWLYIGTRIAPGYNYVGPPLRDGRVLTYKCNGFRLLILTLTALAVACRQGVLKATMIYDNMAGLFFWANVIALAMSTYLFVRGRWRGFGTASFYDDFVMGTELVPMAAGIKINFFWLKPSMMGWLLINLSFLAKHYEINNGEISTAMALFQFFTGWYVVDYFYLEDYVTSTWDMIAEKFGLMLVWGDLVFIPFTFTIQAWFLVSSESASLNSLEAALMTCVFALGYTIFRLANKQKHDFKRNGPTSLVWGKKPVLVGGKLLASGWWGIARHINYLGDLLLALAFSLPCKDQAFSAYFYPFYLTILLIHREWRDEAKCAAKYGAVWKEYCDRVPYRIVPYLY